MAKSDPEICGNRIELDNGEHVTSCHKRKGHEGPHEGFCLGSRAIWTDDPEEPKEADHG